MHERDIWRTAVVMLKRHGEDATVQASMRADELMAEGDRNGQRIWLRILAAMAELTASEPPGPVH